MVNTTRKAAATQNSTSSSIKDSSNSLNEFSKAILTLANKQEAFVKSVELVNQFTEDLRTDLRTDIQSKWIESENLKKSVEIERKNLQIETEQQLKEFKYKAAISILENREEVAIGILDLQELRLKIKKMEDEFTDKVLEKVAVVKATAKRVMESSLDSLTLKHTAETAFLRAKVQQQEISIQNLVENISNLKEEVAAQRQLTKEVAMAGKTGAISQYMGKQT